MSNQCKDCKYCMKRDLFQDGKDIVYFCECDETFLGYEEEMKPEKCRFLSLLCIEDWAGSVQRIRLGSDNKLELCENTSFQKGKYYKLLAEGKTDSILYSEQGKMIRFKDDLQKYFDIMES